ncbi:hypothetical protein DFA_03860 [Cavenderia fasciculata]|uniref:Uncharacterized protein n=1 Tax=Cavenderia fasciculata TaxID=261658 RepID=F4Q0L5_CACFS|nr:uncharacterized protein DFA_03860 [Cavenderia fasciculata]EGG18366.1 hypothetical protein DFA_03860 [Cavenderia fasciculata]|eukprot:XP_004366270.1 hypothetical protein DFA_03860 [Cavenderia fasciculata]
MGDSVVMYLSFDKNMLANDYVNPKWSEETKGKIIETIAKQEQQEKEKVQPNAFEEAANPFGFGGGRIRVQKKDEPVNKALAKFHQDSGFLDVMSYSHSVGQRNSWGRRASRYKRLAPQDDDDEHGADFTVTLYENYLAPIFQGMCVGKEVIQQAVIRHYGFDDKKRTFGFREYELGFVTVSNKSVSGGTGGSPVQTLSLTPTVITTSVVSFDVDTGKEIEYSTSTLDYKFKDRCKRTILPIDPSNPLILDDTKEETKQILKDRNIDYTVNDGPSTTTILVGNQLKDFKIYRRLKVDPSINIDDLTTKIAELLGKEKTTIKGLLNTATQICLEPSFKLEEDTVIDPIFV